VTVSFHAEGNEPWTTSGVSSDLNQAALMAIVDGFHYWLLKSAGQLGAESNAAVRQGRVSICS
jgi:2-isopropylmalate synthase